jgi:hypothetical protein
LPSPRLRALDDAGEAVADVGVYATEALAGVMTGGLSVIAEKVFNDNTGYNPHDLATEGLGIIGDTVGDAVYDWTNDDPE